MADIVVSGFPGISPRQESASAGGVTPATTAENCDLFQGVLKPFAGNTFAEGGHSGDFVRHAGGWISGLVRPVQWSFGDLDLLIHKTGTSWSKRVGASTASLGLASPGAPALIGRPIEKAGVPAISNVDPTVNNVKLEFASYTYYVSFSKMVNGVEVEGPLSLGVAADPYYDAKIVSQYDTNAVYDETTGQYWDKSALAARFHLLVEPPAPGDATIQFWNLYRADNGDTPKLIEQTAVAGGTGTVNDSKTTHDRGRSINELRNNSEENYDISYLVTWERTVGGMIDESAPSTPVSIVGWNIGTEVSRPVAPPPLVTHWNIYRISTNYDPTTTYQLVASVPVGTNTYTDYLANHVLGREIPTSYETGDGQSIVLTPPPVEFDGVSSPHHGMLFAWKGGTLYWSEPGKPDSWPVQYQLEAVSDIVACVPNGSEILIITQRGLQRGIGASPSVFYASPAISGEGGVGYYSAISTQVGVFYLSHAGLVRTQGSFSEVISARVLGTDYFDSINTADAFMEYHEGVVHIFHDGGVVRHDTRDGKYTTLTSVYTNSYADLATGQLVVLDGTTLENLGEDASSGMTFEYKTGDIVLGEPEFKRFKSMEFYGEGTMAVDIEIDGVSVVTDLIDMGAMIRDRTTKTPIGDKGRSMKIKMQGTGTVREIRVSVVKVAS